MNDTTCNHYQIGDAKITRVSELLIDSLTPAYLYPDWDAALLIEHGHWLTNGSMDPSLQHVRLSIHTWVIELDDHTFLIDTGVGNHKSRPFMPLFDQLQTSFLTKLAAVINPNKVDHVLLTHLHADHVGWNTQLIENHWLPVFPNAKYVFSAAETRFFSTHESANRRVVFNDSVLPLIKARQTIELSDRGQEYLDGIQFIPTPGHSPGHMSILLRSRGEEALFIGDVMHFPLQVYRPQWNSIFCASLERARTSRRWLLEYAAENRTVLFTAHFPESSAGIVTRNHGRFSWQYV